MTSAVLYGTTSDNELRPVQVTDSGEFVTDGGGVRDWYENLYVGGSEGAPSISLLNDGSITAPGTMRIGDPAGTSYAQGFVMDPVHYDGSYTQHYCVSGQTNNPLSIYRSDNVVPFSVTAEGTITAIGDVYAENFIPSSGFDLNKIGQALSTIYDVIDSVDDLQGLKNLFHLLLDNLKSDPTPPPPTPPPE